MYLFQNSFWDCIHSLPVPLRCLFTFIVNKIYIKFIINFKENPISTRKEIPRSKVIFCYLKWTSSVSYQIYEVYTDQNEGLVLSGNHSQKPLYWKFPYQRFFSFLSLLVQQNRVVHTSVGGKGSRKLFCFSLKSVQRETHEYRQQYKKYLHWMRNERETFSLSTKELWSVMVCGY